MYCRLFAKFNGVTDRFLSEIAVAVLWTLGLLLGIICALNINESYLSLMRTAAACRVSIVGLFTSAYLPFLIVTFFAYIRKRCLVYFFSVCNVISFAFCAMSATLAFGNAGWLVQPLLQFSNVCLLPLYCWFVLKLATGNLTAIKRDFVLVSVVSAAVCGLDYCLVSPFLAKLIEI